MAERAPLRSRLSAYSEFILTVPVVLFANSATVHIKNLSERRNRSRGDINLKTLTGGVDRQARYSARTGEGHIPTGATARVTGPNNDETVVDIRPRSAKGNRKQRYGGARITCNELEICNLTKEDSTVVIGDVRYTYEHP